jgi:hypothetical protein
LNFDNNSNDNKVIDSMMARLNRYAANMELPLKPSPTCTDCNTLLNNRIQFELVGKDYIYGVPNYPYLEYTQSEHGTDLENVMNVFFTVDTTSVNKDMAGNVLLTPTGNKIYIDGGYAVYVGGDTKDYVNNIYNNGSKSTPNYVTMINTYAAFETVLQIRPWVEPDRDKYYQGNTRRLMHEIFHVLGQHHLYNTLPCTPTEFEYLSDIFENNPILTCPIVDADPYIPTSNSTNNIMHYSLGNNISPMQIGQIHRHAFLGTGKQYVYPTEAPTVHPWLVEEDEVWDFPIRVFQDIRVRSGSTLTIKCRVELPTDARIVVEPGSKLIIDGGIVTSYHQNATWGGIEVMGDNSQLSKASYQGYLELKNGAIVQHGGVRNFTWENGAQGGGIIRAENSHFHNSWRMVELNNYVLPYYDVVTNISNCSFKNCTFINDDDAPFIKMGHSDAALFTSFQTPKGVVIENCVFENQISETLQPQHKRGGAIHVAGSGLSITNSSFTGFKIGINGEGYTNSPETSMKIYSNTFENITKNITLTAQPFDNVKKQYHPQNVTLQYAVWWQRYSLYHSDAAWGVLESNSRKLCRL